MQPMQTARAITLHLPDPLYQRAQETAQALQQSVEAVLLDAIATALPPLAGLPSELADDLAKMAFLDDAELWQVARSILSHEHYRQMDELLARKGQGQLTAEDQQTLDRLQLEYESHLLRRGQAAILLQRRGHDLSDPAVLDRTP